MAEVIDDSIKQPDNTPPQQAGQPASNTQQQVGQAPSTVQQKPNARTGTGFTNLNRVLQANTGNRLGSTVAGGIQQQGNQVKSNLATGQQNFNTQSQAGRVGTDADVANRSSILNGIMGNGQQTGAGPNAPSDADAASFAKYRAGQYGGPQGLQNADQIRAQAAQAQALGGLTGTAGGQQALLQRYAAGNAGGYTGGKSRLDALLLGQQGSGELKQARQGTAGLERQVTGAQSADQAAAQGYQQQAQQFGTDTKNLINTGLEGEGTDLSQRTSNAAAGRQAQFAALQKSLAPGSDLGSESNPQNVNLDPGVAAALGLKGGEVLYNTDLSQYLTQNPDIATRGNVASAQDYARAQALQKLGGNDISQTGQSLLGDLSDPTKAGSYANEASYTSDPSLQAKLAYDLGDQGAGRQAVLAAQQSQGGLDASRTANESIQNLDQEIASHNPQQMGTDGQLHYNNNPDPGTQAYQQATKQLAGENLSPQSDAGKARLKDIMTGIYQQQAASGTSGRNAALAPLGYWRTAQINNMVNGGNNTPPEVR